MTTMKCCRRLAIGATAACLITLAAVAALAEQPRWQMHRTLLDSPMMDAAFPDANTVLIANQNGLVTLNTEAEVLKRQGIDSTVSYPILAENGSYAVVHHRRRVPQFSESITLYSVAGETGATFPISGSPYLAPNGDWLLTVDKYANRVSIYNARGDKLREDTYPEIRDYGMKFSADGRHVALNLPQNGVDAIAVVYDSIGRLQTKVRHVLGQAQPGLTPNGDTLVLIARAAVTIYDETGTEKQRIQRGRNAGVGMLTRDGEELWLVEDGGLRVQNLANADSRTVALSEPGAVVKLTDEPSGQRVLIGRKCDYWDSSIIWIWQAVERSSDRESCRLESRSRNGHAALGADVIAKGTEEIEIWESVKAEGR